MIARAKLDDIDDVFMQEAPWKGDGGSSITADARSVIDPALVRLSKVVPTSGSKFADFVKRLLDELEASHAATAKAGKEVE